MRWLVFLFFGLISMDLAADQIKLYRPSDLVKPPNIHNLEHAVKQRAELEAKLLQWQLTKPLRDLTQLPNRTIQSLPPLLILDNLAVPEPMSADEKVR